MPRLEESSASKVGKFSLGYYIMGALERLIPQVGMMPFARSLRTSSVRLL